MTVETEIKLQRLYFVLSPKSKVTPGTLSFRYARRKKNSECVDKQIN